LVDSNAAVHILDPDHLSSPPLPFDLNNIVPPTIPSIPGELSELDKTVEIGQIIGFEIKNDNAILKEVLGENGEQMFPQ